MSDQNKNDLYNNLGSDAFLRATMKTRLSLLGKELYDNIENLILDENILSNAFKKRNLDKKTIYSSNKFKLNLDELNSDSASVENVLIEEKHREILFKGEEDDDNEEKIDIEKIKNIKNINIKYQKFDIIINNKIINRLFDINYNYGEQTIFYDKLNKVTDQYFLELNEFMKNYKFI